MPKQKICDSHALAERNKLVFDITYDGQPKQALIIRYEGTAYCYLNECVHMHNHLDVNDDEVFDEEGDGDQLRCSMHGVTYDPASGRCLAPICEGKSLTSIRITERDGEIFLKDKSAQL